MSSPHSNARYALFLLTALSALSFMDRQMLAVLTQPVKAEFGLSDLQIGLITGLGFALTFSILGVPLGRWADRRGRINLILFCRTLGAGLGILGAAATGFWTLVLSRSGSAVSDAGSNPASMSLVADLYPIEQRSRAMSVFAAGGSIGALMALIGGSWLAQTYGWRVSLAVVGGMILLLTLLMRLTMNEPPRHSTTATTGQRGAVRAIWNEPVTRWLIIASACVLIAGYSFGSWNTALMVRRNGFSLQTAGLISGAAAVASLFGGLVSGQLTDRLTRRDRRWQVGVPMLGVGMALPIGLTYLMAPTSSLPVVAGLVVSYAFFITWWVAPTYAALSMVVPPQRRSTGNAMLLLAGSILGNGLGPIATGWLSDLLAPMFGTSSLAWALVGAIAMLLPGLYAFDRARRVYVSAYKAAAEPTTLISSPT